MRNYFLFIIICVFFAGCGNSSHRRLLQVLEQTESTGIFSVSGDAKPQFTPFNQFRWDCYLHDVEQLDQPLEEVLKKAKSGDAFAQNELALMYYLGQGVPKDYIEAVKWGRRAAEQGYVSAQYNLGVMYQNAEGIIKYYKEAVLWYQKAAERGHAGAQYNLGVMYQNGYGVTKDMSEALKWYTKAVKQGHVDVSVNPVTNYAAQLQRRSLLCTDQPMVEFHGK